MSQKSNLNLLMLDFSQSRTSQGFELRYFDELKEKQTFLELFLQRVQLIRGDIDHTVAIIHHSLKSKLDPYFHKYTHIQKIVLDEDFDHSHYTNHSEVMKTRKWNYQTLKGGVKDITLVDELLPMGLIKDISEQVKPNFLLYLNPEMPFFSTKFAEELIEAHSKDKVSRFPILLRSLTPGISPFLITQTGLGLFKDANWMASNALFSTPHLDGAWSIRKFLEVSEESFGVRGNLMLRSIRECQQMKVLYEKVSGNLSEESLQKPELLEFTQELNLPREFEIELSSTSYDEKLRLPQLLDRNEMSISLIKKINLELCAMEDALLSIGDLSDVLSYSHLKEMVEEFSIKKPHGLHFIFDAVKAYEQKDKILMILNARPDVITFRVTSLSYSEDIGLEKFETWLEQFCIEARSNSSPPTIHLEMNKREDRWRDILVIHEWSKKYNIGMNWLGYNDFAGQLPKSKYMLNFHPNDRSPCEKIKFQMMILSDGTVPLCKQDYACTILCGDVNDHSLEEIWTNGELSKYREKHLKSQWDTVSLCKNCHHWLHT